VEQSPFRDANSCWASNDMPAFYGIRILIAMFRIVRQLERIMKKEMKVISTKIIT